MRRYASENSLRNILNYIIAVLPAYFLIADEFDKNEYNMLSNNTQNTIKLVKKLSNTSKVRPIYPDQIYCSNDTSLFTYSGNTKENKPQ